MKIVCIPCFILTLTLIFFRNIRWCSHMIIICLTKVEHVRSYRWVHSMLKMLTSSWFWCLDAFCFVEVEKSKHHELPWFLPHPASSWGWSFDVSTSFNLQVFFYLIELHTYFHHSGAFCCWKFNGYNLNPTGDSFHFDFFEAFPLIMVLPPY